MTSMHLLMAKNLERAITHYQHNYAWHCIPGTHMSYSLSLMRGRRPQPLLFPGWDFKFFFLYHFCLFLLALVIVLVSLKPIGVISI